MRFEVVSPLRFQLPLSLLESARLPPGPNRWVSLLVIQWLLLSDLGTLLVLDIHHRTKLSDSRISNFPDLLIALPSNYARQNPGVLYFKHAFYVEHADFSAVSRLEIC